MRINPDSSGDILAAIYTAQQQEQTALEQLASGRRVNRPSDDPSSAAAELELQDRVARNDQYLQNVSSLNSLLQTVDSSLGSVDTALNRAMTLGVEGASTTLSDAQRQQIAADVDGIREQVIQLANLSFHGTYVFGGTANDEPPFTTDPSSPDGVAYGGNHGVNTIAIADGRSIPINVPGDQLFLHSSSSVLGALQQLATDLKNGDPDAISNATTDLRRAYDYFSQQRVFYGNTLNQTNADQTFLNQQATSFKAQQDALVGVDFAAAVTSLTQAQTAHSAALAAAAKVLPQSLLDYLK